MCMAKADSAAPNRLILFQGFLLNAYHNDRYVEVKRLDAGRGTFYGYGWLDKDRVFVAYQDDSAGGAYAAMEIVDLRNLRTAKLKGIGGVGESFFDVNPTTGSIVFSTDVDVKLINIDTNSNSYRIDTIKPNTFCWGAFWIDSDTIGCKLMDKEGNPFVKYRVPQRVK